MALVETITDDFSSQQAQFTGWGANVTATGGLLTFTATWTDLNSATTYDARNSPVIIECPGGQGGIELRTASNDRVMAQIGAPQLRLVNYDGGAYIGQGGIDYNATDHRWWRLTINSDQTSATLDTSPDGTTWTNRLTRSISPAGNFEFATLRISSLGTQPVTFDNLNPAPPDEGEGAEAVAPLGTASAGAIAPSVLTGTVLTGHGLGAATAGGIPPTVSALNNPPPPESPAVRIGNLASRAYLGAGVRRGWRHR